MSIYDLPPVSALLDVAADVVSRIAATVQPALGPLNAAAAIVLVTLGVRALLIPVGRSQVRADLARRRLAPRLAELRRRYGRDRALLQRKTLELYASASVSPLAGILPTLAQAPVVSIVYGLFTHPVIGGHANALLSAHLLGAPLGASVPALLAAGPAWPALAVSAALLAVLALVATLTRRSSLRWAASAPTARPSGAGPAARADAGTRVAAALSWTPFLTVVFAALVPLAAALYLAVTTAWTLAERAVLRRALAA